MYSHNRRHYREYEYDDVTSRKNKETMNNNSCFQHRYYARSRPSIVSASTTILALYCLLLSTSLFVRGQSSSASWSYSLLAIDSTHLYLYDNGVASSGLTLTTALATVTSAGWSGSISINTATAIASIVSSSAASASIQLYLPSSFSFQPGVDSFGNSLTTIFSTSDLILPLTLTLNQTFPFASRPLAYYSSANFSCVVGLASLNFADRPIRCAPTVGNGYGMNVSSSITALSIASANEANGGGGIYPYMLNLVYASNDGLPCATSVRADAMVLLFHALASSIASDAVISSIASTNVSRRSRARTAVALVWFLCFLALLSLILLSASFHSWALPWPFSPRHAFRFYGLTLLSGGAVACAAGGAVGFLVCAGVLGMYVSTVSCVYSWLQLKQRETPSSMVGVGGVNPASARVGGLGTSVGGGSGAGGGATAGGGERLIHRRKPTSALGTVVSGQEGTKDPSPSPRSGVVRAPSVAGVDGLTPIVFPSASASATAAPPPPTSSMHSIGGSLVPVGEEFATNLAPSPLHKLGESLVGGSEVVSPDPMASVASDLGASVTVANADADADEDELDKDYGSEEEEDRICGSVRGDIDDARDHASLLLRRTGSAGPPSGSARHRPFASYPLRIGWLQSGCLQSNSMLLLTSLVLLAALFSIWRVDVYLLVDRNSSLPLQPGVAEYIPQTLAKSVEALYAYDGFSKYLALGSVFALGTNLYCGSHYSTILATNASQYDAIQSSYVVKYNVSMPLFVLSSYMNYTSVNAWFVRDILLAYRPLPSQSLNPDLVTSPGDGRVTAWSANPLGVTFWVKGSAFTMDSFLTANVPASAFLGGSMLLVRMAPQDYHRFHAPVACTLRAIYFVAGNYESVNSDGMTSGNDAILNVRTVMLFDSAALGQFAYVAIGALCVASVTIHGPIPAGQSKSNVTGTAVVGQSFARGDRLGYFQFGGSTIAIVTRPGVVRWDDDIVYASQARVEMLINVNSRVGLAVGGAGGWNAGLTPS